MFFFFPQEFCRRYRGDLVQSRAADPRGRRRRRRRRLNLDSATGVVLFEKFRADSRLTSFSSSWAPYPAGCIYTRRLFPPFYLSLSLNFPPSPRNGSFHIHLSFLPSSCFLPADSDAFIHSICIMYIERGEWAAAISETLVAGSRDWERREF